MKVSRSYENFSRLYEKYSRSYEIFSRYYEKYSRSYKKFSRYYEKVSRSYENFSRYYEKYSRYYENLSRLYEKISRPYEKYSRSYEKNIFFLLLFLTLVGFRTIAPTVLKFYMEHDLPPGTQNYKIGSGRICTMAAITENSKNNKINFFSRTAGYFWLNFGMEYQWNIGNQNCQNEKNL